MAKQPIAGTSSWSRPAWLVSAATVATLVVLTVWVVLGRGDGPPAAAPTTTTAPGSPAPAAGGAPSPSPVPAGASDEIPRRAPEDVRWSLWYGIALPSSPTAGPSRDDGSGYAHTPTGALLAASQIPYRVIVGDNWRSSVERQVVAGPGRNALIAALEQITERYDTSGFSQIGGFRFVSYEGDRAVIDLVVGRKGSTLRAVPTTVRWIDGDWRLVVTPRGEVWADYTLLESLDGYVAWAGVS
jgi:hypothetical protein